jgi:hypothetical protein
MITFSARDLIIYGIGSILVITIIYIIFDHKRMLRNKLNESFDGIVNNTMLDNNLSIAYPTPRSNPNPSISPGYGVQMINATHDNYVQNIKNIAAVKAREVEIKNLEKQINDINKNINYNILNMKLSS